MLNSDLFMMITESTNEEAELIRNLRLVSGVARNHVRFPPFLAVIGLANQGIMLIAKLQLSGLAELVMGRVISWVTGFVALYC